APSDPLRTKPTSARAPSASPSASRRIDLPAPVSPVSTPSPESNSRSRLSTSTTLRIASCLSTARPQVGSSALRSRRLGDVLADQLVCPVIPLRAGVVAAQDGCGFLRFLRDAQRKIALYETLQCLGRVVGRLILIDNLAEVQGRGEQLARTLVIAPDLHLLA